MKLISLIYLILVAYEATAQGPVKNFSLTDVIHDTSVSLDQFSSAPAVVVVFTSNACPYDLYYTDRLKELITQYSGKVSFLLINAHLDPEETPEEMKKTASGWSHSVAYLSDKDQLAMDALGAKRSPEAFLLLHAKGGFVIRYSGALDDSPQEAAGVSTRYLKDAIDNLLMGKPIENTAVRAAGCSIRKK